MADDDKNKNTPAQQTQSTQQATNKTNQTTNQQDTGGAFDQNSITQSGPGPNAPASGQPETGLKTNQMPSDPNANAGTSRQSRNDYQLNNQMLNPDSEGKQAPSAAPGVVPTVPAPASTSPAVPVLEDAMAGNEPERQASDRTPHRDAYRLVRGKHRWQTDDGEWKVTSAQDSDTKVMLTRPEYDSFRDRFEPWDKKGE